MLSCSSESPCVLKLGEHGTPHGFQPFFVLESGRSDDEPMDGTLGEFRRPLFTGSRRVGGQNSRLQVISAMTEYKNKSLEELRYEDYLLNRKGCAGSKSGMADKPIYTIPKEGPLFPFTAPPSSPFGGQTVPGGSFSIGSFGVPSPALPGGGFFGNNGNNGPFPTSTPAQATNMFGQPCSGIFGSAPPSTGVFGNNNNQAVFGNACPQIFTPAFGTPAPAFGTPAPAFSTSAPAFGTPAPAFCTPAPAFGASAPFPGVWNNPNTGNSLGTNPLQIQGQQQQEPFQRTFSPQANFVSSPSPFPSTTPTPQVPEVQFFGPPANPSFQYWPEPAQGFGPYPSPSSGGQFPLYTPTTFQIGSQSYPELPPLLSPIPTGQRWRKVSLSKEPLIRDDPTGPTRQLRSYALQTRSAFEDQIQEWTKRLLSTLGHNNPKETPRLSQIIEKERKRAKPLHWSDPALYMIRGDDSSLLKGCSWKCLKLVREPETESELSPNRRSILCRTGVGWANNCEGGGGQAEGSGLVGMSGEAHGVSTLYTRNEEAPAESGRDDGDQQRSPN